MRARTGSRTWACASACSAASSSSPATSSAPRDANSTEFDLFTQAPVIDFMPDQRELEEKGGTMRLGVYPARLTPGIQGRRGLRRRGHLRAPPPPLRGEQRVPRGARERRHAALRAVTGRPARRDRRAARPPWFVASQFHPEFKSRPDRPHPLFDGFVRAAVAQAEGAAVHAESSPAATAPTAAEERVTA